MAKSLLSVNAGSSSVKVTFYTLDKPPKVVVDAQVSGITAPPQTLKYTTNSTTKKETIKKKLDTPPEAFKYLLQRCMSDPGISEVVNSEDLACICHRVVHGGDYMDAIEINDENLHQLEAIEALAPLYEPPLRRIMFGSF